METMNPAPDLTPLLETLHRARTEVARVVIGQASAVDHALIAIFTNQHVLVEGVPGVAKTLLVRTLGAVLGCETNRIQFTPDLMPSDITGSNVFDMKEGKFHLVPGPVFTSFLLADEINRAPAKTQAALLQAMQERRVSIDRDTYSLPANFTVFATQNPVEYEGTYPLPEAQKDRFLFKISIDYPAREAELELATRLLGGRAPEAVLDAGEVQPVVAAADLAALRRTLDLITFRPELVGYGLDLVRATRSHESALVGAGPRATQALLLAARARAALEGRDYVTPDDVRAMCVPVLEHRITVRPEYEIEGLTSREVVERVLQSVAVPR